jgi:sec-independent protein translocase protein TatC
MNPEPPEEGKVMGFFEHLDELRLRVTRSVMAIAIGMLFAVLFTNQVIAYMKSSYGERLVILGPADSVVIFFRVALMLGAVIAMPIITYHLFMFVMPGLTAKERRWVFMALPGTTLLFLIGLVFTWFLLIPLYINFLKNFQSDIFRVDWTADQYISFVTSVLFWHAAAFELPVVFYVLGRMGFATPRGMIKYWRQAIIGIAIISAIITPTVDPVTMSLIMGVLFGLYLFSILMTVIAIRINRRRLKMAGG